MMSNKRKHDVDVERRAKRRRKRSNSEPPCDTDNQEKNKALTRLFGRMCTVGAEDNRELLELNDEDFVDRSLFGDENEDPLLDSVPVDMDPEQLGFLVCAQETLRFLHRRGIPPQHPVYARLRSRFLRGIDEMGVA
jgi:hypothetical protein